MKTALKARKPQDRYLEKQIFEFSDLQSFLKAVVQYKKKQNPRWSLGVWARQLGIQGSGTLSNFISGRRVPSEIILKKIIDDFQFTEYESQYFEALVALSIKGLNPIAKKVANIALVYEKTGQSYLEIEDKEFKAISDPLFMILREAVKLEGFQPQPQWIRNRLKLFDVTNDEIRDAYQLLVDVGLLMRVGDSYIQTEAHYKTRSDQQSEALRHFYERSLDLNKKAIRSIPFDERHFNSITFCCNPEDIAEIKGMIHEFSRRLMEKIDRSEGKLVVQLHTQLIPQMQIKDEI